MSSIISSQGAVFATAMAVSGTVILLAFRGQNPIQFFTINQSSESSPRILRSCICIDGKRRERKKKKRVHFAEDVIDPSGNSEEFRKECRRKSMRLNQDCRSEKRKERSIPENQRALYNGILRDRVRRTTCSY
ncbi:hypothetical protein ACHQM5_029080 [Ranunculus cassubicifolius]